uniref:tRNA-binding domain-containing protein n=1 Tax=Mantoniella antarctica TaxID=81844 RepID=A0A7S0X363_9CHLO|mmetsp:Transcript_13775/g.33197  ORF Transcript_13775/g.33197 Transcript_13775/m.33197 type:complete len:218 (+) Transcript_13775:82-735(+)|eukprot:CAMPEP_0181362974 /NCGR_PEP_ID=MMETSP1106-20121128/8400_1 /TAXON_ID=81844 /ORGANISM="Mantoniella antarctica, Strain SL-175" /LENGTH=217 /DNA_ID=CAMNT_0023477179 /DNA_START=61 /DNA_END=714 /DNA_ORIENTATION=+
MAFALRAMHCIAAAAPLRAPRTFGRRPSAVAVRAMSDAAAPVAAAPPVHELVDLRVGRVLKAYKHEEADKLYVEEVDVGEEEPRQICSGLVPYMNAEDIEGKLVVVLLNLKSRNMAGIASHGMLLAASDATHEKVELLVCPADAVVGERITFGDATEEQAEQAAPHTENQMKKKKTWEAVAPDLCTTQDCVAAYKNLQMRTSAGPVTCGSIAKGTIG